MAAHAELRERVCAAIRAHGFHAAVADVADGVAVIETAACPLRPLVRERGDVAELDRGMWIGLAGRALEGVEPAGVECDTEACRGDGSCRVTLRVAAT